MAKICRRHKIKLVHFSSVVVFDGKKGNYSEKDIPYPLEKNFYAKTKYAAESIIKSSEIKFIMPRISTLYGLPYKKDNSNFLKMVLDWLKNNHKTPGLFVDQFTNFVSADEVAEGIKELIRKDFCGIINFGGPESVSIFDFAKIAKESFGLKGSVKSKFLLKSKKYVGLYPQNMTLNISLAASFGIRFSRLREKMNKIARETRI